MWLVVAVAAGLSLAAATTFAPFYDQWHYHLGFPYQWLRAGSIETFPRHAYSFFPSNMGLLYLYALAGPGAWAAQALHWWMGAVTAAGSAVIARRLGAPAAGQVLAAAVFAATPSVVQVGALAAADLGVAAYATGAVIALLELRKHSLGEVRWAAVSGAFAGLAAGTKYLALASVVVPVAAAAAVLSCVKPADARSRFRRFSWIVLVFVIAVSVTVGPWFLRNAIQTGNPVYPYFATMFAGADGDGSPTDTHVASAIGDFSVTSGSAITAITLGTFSKRGHAGDIGPVHLWLMPLLIVWMWHRRSDGDAWLVFAVLLLGIAVWAAGPPLGRYLLPSLALAAGLAGAAWSDAVGGLARSVRYGLSCVLLLILLANCNPVRGEYLGYQLACFLGFRTDQAYLRENCTQLDAVRAVNDELPRNSLVLLVGEPRPFGIERDVVIEDAFRAPLLVELAESSSSSSEIARRLRSRGITHILWNGAEAARIAAASGRDDYLACTSPEARALLDRFLSRTVVVVRAERWWMIAAIPEG